MRILAVVFDARHLRPVFGQFPKRSPFLRPFLFPVVLDLLPQGVHLQPRQQP